MHGERGSVTAEFVTVLPAVIIVLATCLGALTVVGQQLRLVDAAAVAARASGRGESSAAAGRMAAGIMPGTRIVVEPDGEIVCVLATNTVRLFGSWPIGARSCAAASGQ